MKKPWRYLVMFYLSRNEKGNKVGHKENELCRDVSATTTMEETLQSSKRQVVEFDLSTETSYA